MTSAEKDELVAELAEAYLERVRSGELLSVTVYAAEYPECESDLLDLLPLMLDVEGLGRTSMPPAPALAQYPERLGDYHLLERIGSGGMGTVFRARQESLHREVAVKILAPSWSTDARISEAFENESRVLAGLRHTNIVEVFGAGQEERYRYYVMGLVQGQGLSAGRLGAAFPGVPYEQAVARVGVQAARALAFAHAHGVIHRDIKPGNLLMGNDGVLLVSDFGLATILNAGEEAPLVAQSHDGTVRYMAPERLLGEGDTFAGDQYSLGLTLYELLARKAVFRESEPGKLVRTICSDSLPPLRGFGELGAVINKAVAFKPEARYESMQAMADDLQRVLDSEPVKAHRTSLWRRYRLWMKRRPAAAMWCHVAAGLLLLLYATISVAYARVKKSWRSENEQRERAELNEQIADASLQRIFASMVNNGSGGSEGEFLPPTRSDVRLLQDLMPYYEQLITQDAGGSDKVADAAYILAAIALQTGDYAMSEKYFRKSADMVQPGSHEYVLAVVGLASSIFAQEDVSRNREAVRLLLALEKVVPPSAPFETRLEVVRALHLVLRHERRRGMTLGERTPRPGNSVNDKRERRRDVAEAVLGAQSDIMNRAAAALAALLREQPNDVKVRLLQAEMLSLPRSAAVSSALAPAGETPFSILSDLLKEQPNSDELKRAYVRLATSPAVGGGISAFHPETAARYAQELLAASPADGELIMLFLSARDLYARKLASDGQEAEAANERERTLGVLSFVTSRDDFTPSMREKLVKWVALHYVRGNVSQREQELRTLLKDYDAERIKSLRDRFQRLRRDRFVPGGRFNRRRTPSARSNRDVK
ncbi:MAG: serine/threonine protein kinase [Akkermansia sp.]|nr:serine/threonine protein kinase [Akkermansia sp.]